MKSLSWKLVLPLAVISFTIFTKWWFVLPVDAPDTMMWGFPLPCVSEGWHTSLSLQIFVMEFVIDFLVYFSFWFVLIYLCNRYWIRIKVHKLLTAVFIVLMGLIGVGSAWVATMPEHIYSMKRDFGFEELESGYEFIWTERKRPAYKKGAPVDE